MMTLLIVLGEVTLILVIIMLALGVKHLRRKHRERSAVNALVTSINSNQTTRVQGLADVLKERGEDDEDALRKANEVIKKQNEFYQNAVDLYFNRNCEVLTKLDHRLEDLISQYKQVLVDSGDGETTTKSHQDVALAVERLSTDIEGLSKEVEGLRSENGDLQRQLKAAEQELDQLGREYVSAFNRKRQEEEAAGREGDGASESDSETTAADNSTFGQFANDAGPRVNKSAAALDSNDVALPDEDEGFHSSAPATAQAATRGAPEATPTAQAMSADDIDALLAETQAIPDTEPSPSQDPGPSPAAIAQNAASLFSSDEAAADRGLLADLDLEQLNDEQADDADEPKRSAQ